MSASHQAPDDWLIAESVTPAGLRLRAALLRETGQPNDSGSTARHLELAADKIEGLEDQVLGLKLLSRAQSKLASQQATPALSSDAVAQQRDGE